MSGGDRSSGGFTLIEMLASILLTSIVVSFAVGFYIQLSRATETATLRLRDSRHAATILDRIARDLQSAMLLVKPEEMDPLEHPWIFLAEPSFEGGGADRVKFIARSTHQSAVRNRTGANLETISYQLAHDEQDDALNLYRSSSPGLPASNELRDFPDPKLSEARVVARDIEAFSLRFRRGEEEWIDSWDSWALSGSSQLPEEIELTISLHSDSNRALAEDAEFDDEIPEPLEYSRRVALLLRPIDLDAEIEAAIELAGGEGSGEDGCLTVRECLERSVNAALWQEYFDRCTADPVACARVNVDMGQCYRPDLLPEAVGCQ